MARFNVVVFLLTLLSLLSSIPAYSQSEDPTTQQGLKPYASYHGGDIDSISLVNGKLDLHIPLVSWSQRGKLKLEFTIRYDNPRLFVTQTGCNVNPLVCQYNSWFQGKGVEIVPNLAYGIYQQQLVDPPSTVMGTIYSVQDSSGASHELGKTTGTLYESVDATGFAWNSSTNIITDRDGIRYYSPSSVNTPGYIPGPVAKVEDPNGNQILYSSGNFTGTLGRTITTNKTTTTDYSGCTGQLPISSAALWQVPGPEGGTATYKFCYATVAASF